MSTDLNSTDLNDTGSYAGHTDFSDPGEHRALLAEVPTDTAALHEVVTNTILHYRADRTPATPQQLADIDDRWITTICSAAVERRPGPLAQPREDQDKVGGCCRDHTLLAVAILREHGIPARSRIGFAGYFTPGFHHDHVVVERWDDGRWVRFDPELPATGADGRAHDLPTGLGSPFETAAQVWHAHRAGQLEPKDLSTYGVGPGMTMLSGPGFTQGYVFLELAHLMGSELLLWDDWFPQADQMPPPEPDVPMPTIDSLLDLTDEIADLLIKYDGGDVAAGAELAAIWERIKPADTLNVYSPTGRNGTADLHQRVNIWEPQSDGT